MALFEQAVRDLISAQSFEDSSGSEPSYFVGFDQADPDFTLTVIPEPGAEPRRRVGEFPSFVVRVRHPDGLQANEYARRVFEFLQEFQGRIGSSPVWPVARIRAQGGPIQIGRDRGAGQGRWIVQQTFNAITRFTTTS